MPTTKCLFHPTFTLSLISDLPSPDELSLRMYVHRVMEHLAGTLPLSRYPKSNCDLICVGSCWDLKRVFQTWCRIACMSMAQWSTLLGRFLLVGFPRVVVTKYALVPVGISKEFSER